MHLADGAGGDRRPPKLRKRLVQRAVDFALDDPPRFGGVEGKGVLGELPEFPDVGLRDDIAARGQHLAEFDEGGTEFLQHPPNAHRSGLLVWPGEDRGALAYARKAEAVRQVAESMPRQHRQDGSQPPNLATGTGNLTKPDRHAPPLEEPERTEAMREG